MLPEEKARIKLDKQLNNAGWDIVSRQDYVPNYTMAIKDAVRDVYKRQSGTSLPLTMNCLII